MVSYPIQLFTGTLNDGDARILFAGRLLKFHRRWIEISEIYPVAALLANARG